MAILKIEGGVEVEYSSPPLLTIKDTPSACSAKLS